MEGKDWKENIMEGKDWRENIKVEEKIEGKILRRRKRLEGKDWRESMEEKDW